MQEIFLLDMPTELLSKIITCLPLSDRGRLEATCKEFLRISHENITNLDFTITTTSTTREADGLAGWLMSIGNTALQKLRIVCPFVHINESEGIFCSTTSPILSAAITKNLWCDDMTMSGCIAHTETKSSLTLWFTQIAVSPYYQIWSTVDTGRCFHGRNHDGSIALLSRNHRHCVACDLSTHSTDWCTSICLDAYLSNAED